MCFFISESRRMRKKDKDSAPKGQEEKRRKGDLVGKSLFVLKERISTPQAAKEIENEKDTENAIIFAPSNVPTDYPRIIPSGELDDVFGAPPPGEDNPPLDIDCPMPQEPDTDDEEEEEDEHLPAKSHSQALGISFEQMGEAYRTVVHNPVITDEKKEETGRILLNLKHTDMFEAMVSSSPEREDRVSGLMDSYLKAFRKRKAEEAGEDEPPVIPVPKEFDMKKYV
jgi:hypothetical protein